LATKAASIHIGTSGWHYDHWRGVFYSVDLVPSDFLYFYAGRFGTVEINNSFYQLPRPDTFVLWRDTVPAGFVFAVKASRFITHMKKLKDPGQPLKALLHRVVLLGDKLGPILFQLPPRWRLNHERLLSFLRTLPRGFRYALEFRDTSWFDPRVYDALAEHGAAFCIYELAGNLSPRKVTADFVYLRLHGPGAAYRGQYEPAVLSEWADFFSHWYGQGKDIFCYFDNDESGYAALDAIKLQEMVEARKL
jgi:uncharacterized protein YecE (DUF72 family)